MHIAKQILSLIDLTSLNDYDTDIDIVNLCKSATTKYGDVAAICIYSHLIKTARSTLISNSSSKINIATVINFPRGLPDIELALAETKLAISRGTDEIDLVFPYHALINNDYLIGEQMVKEVKQICKDKILKVIIESGELNTAELIKKASEISVAAGADFIKTSTGKVTSGATLNAAEIMLNVIKESKKRCGFKASGGIKTVNQAKQYLELAEKIMGYYWITSNNFRFGASSLLTDVLNTLDNTNIVNNSAY